MNIIKYIKNILVKFFAQKALYYINGPETLPEPLTAEEENRLLHENNEKSKEKLIVHNLRLVVYIARKFENTGINIEDLISIGTKNQK